MLYGQQLCLESVAGFDLSLCPGPGARVGIEAVGHRAGRVEEGRYHPGDVTGVAYSVDGKLGTTSLRVLNLWNLGTIQIIKERDLVSTACSRLTANFSEAQWSNLFTGEPFRILCENIPVP